MRPILTTTQQSWLAPISNLLAVSAAILSGFDLVGWLWQIESLTRLYFSSRPLNADAAGAFFVFAVSLLGFQLRGRAFALLAVVPGCLGLLIITQRLLGLDLGMGALLGENSIRGIDYGSALNLPHVITAFCFVLAGFSVPLLHSRVRTNRRNIALALSGSVLASIGTSTVLGYTLQLPAVYHWATAQELPMGTAILLLLLGCNLLVIALQEQQRDQLGVPSWVPLPVVVAWMTLTGILWLGLREAEIVRLNSATQYLLREYATLMNSEFERETDELERLASRQAQDASEEAWKVDARHTFQELNVGSNVSRLDAEGRVIRTFPKSAETAAKLVDHRADPLRAAALRQSRERLRGTIAVGLSGISSHPGFAIYAPIVQGAEVTGYATSDLTFEHYFAQIDRALKVPGNYVVEIQIDANLIHRATGETASSFAYWQSEYVPFGDRRVRVALSPTIENLRRNRRFLPELALGAGCGICLLLGLSVHLARTARAGLRAAESSNRQLKEENEERRRAEQALRESQSATRKLSLVASKTDNLVIIATPKGMIEWVNESFERVLEYRLADVVGKNPTHLVIGPETSVRAIRRVKLAIARGQGISTDIVSYSKSGRKYYLHLEVQPVRNESGALENFIAVAADISNRVETERNLRRAKNEADNASRAKSEFLASMSHEIRTPMNGVIGMTSLLLDTPLNQEQRDFVSTIRTSGDALLTIINDILDFSKIESGKMELEALPFELAVCIEDALDLFSVQATAKNLELVYDVAPDVPAWIQGDATRLRQVLANLVNNAVKFTPSGSIAVKVRCSENPTTPKSPERVELIVTVEDTGIGIPPDRLDRLFQPFSQVDSSTTRKYGGTGLGLVICQRLCALMGGKITVRSKLGLGSAFEFSLITEPIHTPPGWGLPELPLRLNYGDILCVEDNAVTQSRLRTFFRLWGARPISAETIDQALRRLAEDPPPIAVVVDHAMLQTSEGEALRDYLCQTDVPALLLLSPGERLEDLAVFAGRRGITTATKPLRTHALIRGVNALFESPPDSLPPFVVPADTQLLANDIPLEILLVEDNAVNQKVALRFLDRLGYRADAVANGIEALNTLQTRTYQVILMDLQMPEMDGFETARQIRRRLQPEKQPKIIALTANALHGDREQCLAAGMDDYITKPVKLLDIAQALRRQFAAGSRPPFNTHNRNVS